MTNLILASASPRRQELLKQIGLSFSVKPSAIEEEFYAQQSPEEVVQQLAFQKAKDVADKTEGDCIVLGADTIVVYQNKILGKPANEDEAYRMLMMLNGQTHHVYTGFALIRTSDYKIIKQYEKTLVKFRALTEEEILSYIKTGEPMDKAGAYGIQKIGSLIVERIDGDYFNVVGLPVAKLARVLKEEFSITLL